METKNKETYWSRFTDEYEEKQQKVVGKELLQLTNAEMLKENNLGSVLELGCGTGLYTETLQKIAKNVVATDFSEKMIEFAKQKRGNFGNVKFMPANALNLEFDEESFDALFMANLIHVIGNANRVIQESNRVLKRGGLLIITSFDIEGMNFFNRIVLVIRYLKAFGKPSKEATKEKTTQKSIECLLVNNGFEITKSLVLGSKFKAMYIRCRKL